METLNFLGLFCSTCALQKVLENSNWNSLNFKKCGKIQITIPQMSESAGDSNGKSGNIWKCGKIQIEISKVVEKCEEIQMWNLSIVKKCGKIQIEIPQMFNKAGKNKLKFLKF